MRFTQTDSISCVTAKVRREIECGDFLLVCILIVHKKAIFFSGGTCGRICVVSNQCIYKFSKNPLQPYLRTRYILRTKRNYSKEKQQLCHLCDDVQMRSITVIQKRDKALCHYRCKDFLPLFRFLLVPLQRRIVQY